MIWYWICVAWIGVSLIGSLGAGRTIHIADEREPRPERPVLRLIQGGRR